MKYEQWQRGIGANGDKGAYISFTPIEGDETWQLAYAMPLEAIFQSVYALTGEGYVIQYRTNTYHNILECSVYMRTPRWQDQQYLQCLCDDALMGLACVLVRLYEDFYGREDWVKVVLQKRTQNAAPPSFITNSTVPLDDEIPF